MDKESKILLSLIKSTGAEAYLYGTWCRIKLSSNVLELNKFVPKTIATTADLKTLKDKFKNSTFLNDNTLEIIFANHNFNLISYKTLKELQNNTNFLCNSVYFLTDTPDSAQNLIINENINAFNDINESIVRTVNTDSAAHFKDFPLDIMEALLLMSQYNYTIYKTTISGMKKSLRYLKTIPTKMIVKKFNQILLGHNAYNTLELMNKIGFFKLKFTAIDLKKYQFFEILQEKSIRINVLRFLNTNKDIDEIYSILFKNNLDELINLNNHFPIMSEKSLNTVVFLIKNIDIPNETNNINLRLKLYESIQGNKFIKNIHDLKTLTNKLAHVYKILTHVNVYDKLLFNICARPYFIEQLDLPTINDENIKKQMLKFLLQQINYPSPQEINIKLNNMSKEN